MRMHAGRTLVLVAIVLAIAVVAARSFWFNDARDIRRRLEALADTASAPERETDLTRLARLGRFFSDDVVLRRGASSFIGGRQAVVGLAVEGAAAYGRMAVSFQDVEVALTDSATATVFTTLRVSGEKAEAMEPRQVSVTFVKRNGEWLVSRGEVLRALDGAP